MAENKETKGKKDAPSKKKGGGKIVFFMIIFGCFVPFGVPSLLICLGFIPTFITLFTEKDPRHPALATIGYMNLVGVLPFIIELWEKGQTMPAAMNIIRQPATWVVMLGAAGIGQLIFYVVPSAIASVLVSKQEARRRVLHDGIAQLETIWGADVSNTLPIEAVRNNQGKKA